MVNGLGSRCCLLGVFLMLLFACQQLDPRHAWLDRRITLVQAQLDSLQPSIQKTEDLRSLKVILDQKMAVVDRLIIGRICWAEKLNQLADILNRDQEMTERVWLSSLRLSEIRTMQQQPQRNRGGDVSIGSAQNRAPVMRGCLEVEGLVQGHGALGMVSRFMELLETDEAFFDIFEKIELEYVKDAAPEGKAFKLSLVMKDPKGVSGS